MAHEQFSIDDLALMGADEVRAAYEAGRLDTLLGRQPSDEERLLAELRRRVPPRPTAEEMAEEGREAPPPVLRSGSQPPALPLNGDPLVRSLSDKLGIDPRRFDEGKKNQ